MSVSNAEESGRTKKKKVALGIECNFLVMSSFTTCQNPVFILRPSLQVRHWGAAVKLEKANRAGQGLEHQS